MKPILKIAILSVLVVFGQPVLASPQDDARYLARHLLTAEFRKSVEASAVQAMAKNLSRELSERSIKVTNLEKLTGLLSTYGPENLSIDIDEITVDHLLDSFDPTKLSALRDILHIALSEQNVDRVEGQNDTSAKSLDEVIAFLETEVEEITGGLALAVAMVGVLMLVVQKAKRIEPNLHAPYMADVLETSGVFQFPNRIFRNDLIREIKNANK